MAKQYPIPNEICLLTVGANMSTKGPMRYDTSMTEQLNVQFKQHGRYCWDRDHLMLEAGDNAPIDAKISYGWCDLEADDQGVFARNIDWTPRAEQLIRDGEYGSFSVAGYVDLEDQSLAQMLNVALCNLGADPKASLFRDKVTSATGRNLEFRMRSVTPMSTSSAKAAAANNTLSQEDIIVARKQKQEDKREDKREDEDEDKREDKRAVEEPKMVGGTDYNETGKEVGAPSVAREDEGEEDDMEGDGMDDKDGDETSSLREQLANAKAVIKELTGKLEEASKRSVERSEDAETLEKRKLLRGMSQPVADFYMSCSLDEVKKFTSAMRSFANKPRKVAPSEAQYAGPLDRGNDEVAEAFRSNKIQTNSWTEWAIQAGDRVVLRPTKQ